MTRTKRTDEIARRIDDLRDAAENLNRVLLHFGGPGAGHVTIEVDESFAELTEQSQALKAIQECLVLAGFGTEEKPPTHIQCVDLVRMLARSTLESGAGWQRTIEGWPEPGVEVLGVYLDESTAIVRNVDGEVWAFSDGDPADRPLWWRPLPVLP